MTNMFVSMLWRILNAEVAENAENDISPRALRELRVSTALDWDFGCAVGLSERSLGKAAPCSVPLRHRSVSSVPHALVLS